MSLTRYLMHDFWTANELSQMETSLNRHRFASARLARKNRERAESAEDELGRLALLVHALTTACLRKGVFTKDELSALIHELDLEDGVQDGKLDPKQARSRRPKA